MAELAEELPLREAAADFLAGAELGCLALHYGTVPEVLEDLLTWAGFLPIGDIARRYWRRDPVGQIAASYGMSGRTLFRLLDRFGIERNGGTRRELPLPSEEIARAYVHERRQIQDIAAELNVNSGTISRRLREVGVHIPLGQRPLDLPEQEIRRRRAAGETLTALAHEFGASAPTIRRRLKDAERSRKSFGIARSADAPGAGMTCPGHLRFATDTTGRPTRGLDRSAAWRRGPPTLH